MRICLKNILNGRFDVSDFKTGIAPILCNRVAHKKHKFRLELHILYFFYICKFLYRTAMLPYVNSLKKININK